jgi:hypothetical protein
MSAFYEMVGRLVVGYVRQRYGAQLRAAAVVGALAVAAAALLAARPSRDPE